MTQTDLFVSNTGLKELAPNCYINYIPKFIKNTKPYIEYLQSLSNFTIRNNRCVTFFGSKKYDYTFYTHAPKPFPEQLLPLLININKISKIELNSVLINLYRNGNDYISYHSDDEKQIDRSCIASLSFGATRDFVIKRIAYQESITYPLSDGDLIFMLGDFHDKFKHGIPKRKTVKQPRWNLTFRKLL